MIAGDWSVRINEAAGIANLFKGSLDSLLGLSGYAGDAKRQIVQARGVAAAVEEILEDAVQRFDSPHIEALVRLAHDMAEQLDAAEAQAQQIDSITTQAITAAVEEASR